MTFSPTAPAVDRAAESLDYELFGLRVRSEIALPELFHASGTGVPDVTIKIGVIPALEDEVVDNFAVTPHGAILNVSDAARYLVTNGNEIIVEPFLKGSERHLRLYLLGSAFGALLHQRRILPLHANSIVIGGRAIAFLGHSGAGKSTIAAWFHDRGFDVLADDVCAVTFDKGRPMAQPGIPRLRMWRDALEETGRKADDFELSFDDADKYNVPTTRKSQIFPPHPIELGAIYLLRTSESGTSSALVEPLRGVEALEALVANTYRGAYVGMLRGAQAHLANCLQLQKLIPIFAVDRQWGKDKFESQLLEMEAHARRVVGCFP